MSWRDTLMVPLVLCTASPFLYSPRQENEKVGHRAFDGKTRTALVPRPATLEAERHCRNPRRWWLAPLPPILAIAYQKMLRIRRQPPSRRNLHHTRYQPLSASSILHSSNAY